MPPRKKNTKATSEETKPTSMEAEWNKLMGEAEKAPKVNYTTKTKLELGNVVEHPVFGTGIVMKLMHPNKAEILFKDTLKLLVHSRD